MARKAGNSDAGIMVPGLHHQNVRPRRIRNKDNGGEPIPTTAEVYKSRAVIAAVVEVRRWQAETGKDRAEKFPHLPTIAAVLRNGDELPDEVRLFLADLIDKGMVKHPSKGRPKEKSFLQLEIDDGWVRVVFEDEHRTIKALDKQARDMKYGVGTPYEHALVATRRRLAGTGHKISIDSIRKAVGQKRAVKHPWER